MEGSILVGVFLAIVGLSVAFEDSPGGVLYPFSINDLLTCHVDNPMGGMDGEPAVIPEMPPRLSFQQIVMQGDHPNPIWLPGNPEFRIPPGSPDVNRLIEFLGEDYDTELTAIFPPARTAPEACEIRPAAEGSGGDQQVHINVDLDALPFLGQYATSGATPSPEMTEDGGRIFDDPSRDDSLQFIQNNLVTTAGILLVETNDEAALCDIHTALCPLNTTWAALPDGYFPKFFAQGTCSNKNCSFPRGKFCEEDFTFTSYVTVLRYDCCFDKALSQIQWACGWRKVQVPIVCDCMCSCAEVFSGN